MKRLLNPQDQTRWERLEEIQEQNDRIMLLYSHFLNEMPRFLTRQMVENLANDCAIPTENAYRMLFSASCGLNADENPTDRLLDREYVRRGVRPVDPALYSSDLYCQTVRFPTLHTGKWSFGQETYLPFEAFVCGNPILTPEFREIPQIAYFQTKFRFPALTENGVEWMAVKPNEIETMREPIREASGNVVTFGLGLGYFTFHASQKENVKTVTVVERDADLISLFETYLLPQFPNRDKIRIVCSDAFDFAEKILPDSDTDFVFADLWHDQSDGLPCYLRLKRLESLSPGVRFSYWIEPILLSSLRRMVFDRIREPDDESGTEIRTFREIAVMLSDEYLRRLAPNIRQLK